MPKKTTWQDVSFETREKLLRMYEAKDNKGISDAADTLHVAVPTLRRYIRFHREYKASLLREGGNREKMAEFHERFLEIEPRYISSDDSTQDAEESAFHFKPGSPLSDIEEIDVNTDQAEWLSELSRLQKSAGLITVMHMHDIHVPFQDNGALEVTYRLAEHAQPHVIVVGSDSMDFALLSTFARDSEIESEIPDELEVAEAFWSKHIARLQRICPNSVLVFIYGNHEFRILRFLEEAAPKLKKTVMKAWRDIIRQGGEVLYLGDDVDWVRMGPLLVMHGNRANQSPAKSVYSDLGGQVSCQFGHVHRLDEYIRRGEDFDVVVAASGCLCKYPHYARGRMRSKWALGTSVMSVDLNSRYVKIDNLKFEKDKSRVWVRFERRVFESEPRQQIAKAS